MSRFATINKTAAEGDNRLDSGFECYSLSCNTRMRMAATIRNRQSMTIRTRSWRRDAHTSRFRLTISRSFPPAIRRLQSLAGAVSPERKLLHSIATVALAGTLGCHSRIASPHVYRQNAPDIICIVEVDSKANAEIISAMLAACQQAIEQQKKGAR